MAEKARCATTAVGEGSLYPSGNAATRGESDWWAAEQAALPILGQLVRPDRDACFAHPAEVHLSQLFTFYGVRWSYEPTTFALSRVGEDRSPAFFTPDFYLPDHRTYIELTTMRQRLVTRKNRKLRLLREAFPGVGIKLLYRRDYLQLVAAYEQISLGAQPECVGRVLYTEEAIAARIDALAGEITLDAAGSSGEPPVLVGVGRGSERFLSSLSGALAARGLPVEHDRITATRFDLARPGQRARVQRPPERDLRGRRVLLVEDVVSTGLSLGFLVSWLRRRGVQDVTACTLLDRAEARLVPVPVRYAGFEVPTTILVGFGLALRQQFSDLPYIAAVTPPVAGPV